MCTYQALGFCEPNQIFRSKCNWCTCDPSGIKATCTGLICCEQGTSSITNCRECVCNDNYETICTPIVGCTTTRAPPISSTFGPPISSTFVPTTRDPPTIFQ